LKQEFTLYKKKVLTKTNKNVFEFYEDCFCFQALISIEKEPTNEEAGIEKYNMNLNL